MFYININDGDLVFAAVLPPTMLRRIKLREMLIATACVALLVVLIRDRLMPNGLDAWGGFRIDQHLISKAACDVDESATLIDGKLTGGFAGGRMLHQGFAILECAPVVRDSVVANIKEEIRGLFSNTEWQYVENLSTPDYWQISALKDGSFSQLIFQFVSPPAAIDDCQITCRLSVQWAELGFSRKWRLEL